VTTFRPTERIHNRAQFQRIYERGSRTQGRYSTIFLLANELGFGRLGVAATKKLGGAVVRNRAKRLIREVFRRNKIAAGYDIVVVPKRGFVDASLTALEGEYNAIIERQLGRPRRTGGAPGI
jgi:ribonuclease P protein component